MYSREQAEIEMAAEIHRIEKCLAMPTTGNREQDEAYLHDAATTSAMIAANKCPNGCGEMVVHQVNKTKICPKCGFSYHSR